MLKVATTKGVLGTQNILHVGSKYFKRHVCYKNKRPTLHMMEADTKWNNVVLLKGVLRLRMDRGNYDNISLGCKSH